MATAANQWHAHLSDTLRSMGFKTTRFDSDVWTRDKGDYYDYLSTHTGDLMVISPDTDAVMKEIQKVYTIKKVEEPSHHLGLQKR